MSKPKTESIKLRLSREDKEALEHKAQHVSLTLSEYLRRCGLNRKLPKPRTSREEANIKQRSLRVLELLSTLTRRLERNSDSTRIKQTISELKEQAKILKEVTNNR